MTLPPGRLRLETSPILIGSAPVLNTTGMVVVAFFAARLDGGPPTAAMTLTLRRTRSAASSGNRSVLPSAQRYSMATFWPSTIAALFEALPKRGQLRFNHLASPFRRA